MEWVVRLDDIEKSKSDGKLYTTDYEICSEVRIPGVLEYRNFFICSPHVFERDKNGLYTYILRIRYLDKEFVFDEKKYSKNGYYFLGGVIGELLAIFSFYFQTRFYLKSVTQGEITENSIRVKKEYDFNNSKSNLFIHKEMFSDEKRNWAHEDGLRLFLDKLILIDQKFHQNLIRAFHWYSVAIKDLCYDHQLFFIKMVSSVESLLKLSPPEPDSLYKKLLSFIDEKHFSDKEGDEIVRWLNNRSIRKRFVSFYVKYSIRFAKGGRRKAPHCYIRKTDIPKYIKRIYDARSAYLHEGVPMYLSSDIAMKEAVLWDIDPTQGARIDRKKIKADAKLPRARWFERITNFCIKQFILDVQVDK